MRIEYVVSLGKNGAKVTHRVISGDSDIGGTPGATGPDDGGTPGATGPDDGGTPGATGPDDGGTPGATGPDDGGTPGATGPDDGGNLPGYGGQTVVVFGPTIITGGPPRDTKKAHALTPIPMTHLITELPSRPILFEGNPNSTGGAVDNASLEAQQQAYWCWAAVGAGIRNMMDRGLTVEQCEVANAVMNLDRTDGGISLALEDCCQNPAQSNAPRSLRKTLEALSNLHRAEVGGVASFRLIQSEIGEDRPVGARIAWDSEGRGFEDGAHFVIITGWKTDNDIQKLTILDPAPGKSGIGFSVEPREVLYENFRDAYMGTGKWVASYFVKGTAK